MIKRRKPDWMMASCTGERLSGPAALAAPSADKLLRDIRGWADYAIEVSGDHEGALARIRRAVDAVCPRCHESAHP